MNRLRSWLRRRRAPAVETERAYDKWRRMGVRIGKDCIIYDVFFDTLVPFLIEVGDRVAISGNVTILAHDGAMLPFTGQERFAPVRILDGSFVGHRAMILPGVTIGPRSIVGAGAVVTKDVPPRMVAVGNPARVVCTLDEYLERVHRRGSLIDMPWLGKEIPEYQAQRKALSGMVKEATSRLMKGGNQ